MFLHFACVPIQDIMHHSLSWDNKGALLQRDTEGNKNLTEALTFPLYAKWKKLSIFAYRYSLIQYIYNDSQGLIKLLFFFVRLYTSLCRRKKRKPIQEAVITASVHSCIFCIQMAYKRFGKWTVWFNGQKCVWDDFQCDGHLWRLEGEGGLVQWLSSTLCLMCRTKFPWWHDSHPVIHKGL